TGLNVVFSLMYALTANYSYYLKEVKGEQGWNPFKGMRL
ncbi:membrane protein, partial [Pseudomonas syringae pv. syringae FF5]